MTCQDTLSCLDQLVDNELTNEQKAQLMEHIETCANCKREFEELKQIKNLLSRAKVFEPSEEYWSEVTGLIKAKTIDVEPVDSDHRTHNEQLSINRNALMRSIISTAAALAILFTALLLGSQQKQVSFARTESGRPIFATADVRDLLSSDNKPLFSFKDQRHLAQGMLLVGIPGVLGRFAILPDLMIITE
ncbi:MAG: zf-HC2 domain-containing protein [bacterium]